MSKKMTVAMIGCGQFCRFFVPLFKLHPYVEKVYVCDLIEERAKEYSEKFQVEIIPTFEDVLKHPGIDCIALFTQRHLHGPMVVKALAAGKHVYSAVPMASEVDHCYEIVEMVRKTGLTYMMGETCYYYPSSIYCRKHHALGDFGRFVYAEGQYHHDISHFSEQFRSDKRSAGLPPFYYPTHSTAMVLAACNSYALKVSAFGYEDHGFEDFFRKGVNQWDNVFSDSFSLMQLANGGVARINECRRIGYKAPSSYVSAFYGTEGGYQFNNAQHCYTRKTAEGVTFKDVSDEINPRAMTEHRGDVDFKKNVANHVWQWNSFSPIQDDEYARLPESYKTGDVPNGHMASHQILIDDFCRAVYLGQLPICNAWRAARWTIPGLIAHQSVLKDGETLLIPDCGNPPVA